MTFKSDGVLATLPRFNIVDRDRRLGKVWLLLTVELLGGLSADLACLL